MVVAGGEGEPAREDQGARGNLAGGDVQVGVDWRGWNGDDLRRRRWSSTMAADSGVGVHRRWIGGGEIALGGQGGSPKLLVGS
jgi:hypothetical protein